MTEILTESFCERCGTRYTFESTAPRKSRLGRARVLSKGVRNFVLSDDASFSEAMAEARSEVELSATSHQLDAFHQTFNFCLTCRQYTCGDCWNQDEGRCLTCAPIPGMELPAAAEPVLAEAVLAEAVITEPENGHVHVEEAWPDADLSSARLARAMGTDTEVDAVAPIADEHGAEISDAAAPALAAAAAAALADDEPAGQAPEPASAEAEPAEAESADQPQLIGVAPGQSLEEALAQYEARLAVQEAADAQVADIADETSAIEAASVANAATPEAAPPEAAVEPVTAAADSLVTEASPSPQVAEAIEAEAEPVPAPDVAAAVTAPVEAPEPEPALTAPEPEPVAAEAPRDDVVPQPTWPAPTQPPEQPAPPAQAPETPASAPWLTVAPEDSETEPQWPTAPNWQITTQRRDVPSTLAGRPLLPQADPSGLWAASAREVLTGAAQVPVPDPAAAPVAAAQPCVSCGLSLSANARFCRRCGTRQG